MCVDVSRRNRYLRRSSLSMLSLTYASYVHALSAFKLNHRGKADFLYLCEISEYVELKVGHSPAGLASLRPYSLARPTCLKTLPDIQWPRKSRLCTGQSCVLKEMRSKQGSAWLGAQVLY